MKGRSRPVPRSPRCVPALRTALRRGRGRSGPVNPQPGGAALPGSAGRAGLARELPRTAPGRPGERGWGPQRCPERGAARLRPCVTQGGHPERVGTAGTDARAYSVYSERYGSTRSENNSAASCVLKPLWLSWIYVFCCCS